MLSGCMMRRGVVNDTKEGTMKILDLSDLYLEQLQDMHSCERQLIKALPKMAKASHHPDLKQAFNDHLAETKEQLEGLNQILEKLGKGPGRKVCKAAAGLVEEGSGLMEDAEEDDVRDVALICAAQKIEHYEIASYGCLRTYATLLGRDDDAKRLEGILGEERKADETLTTLAMSVINSKAIS